MTWCTHRARSRFCGRRACRGLAVTRMHDEDEVDGVPRFPLPPFYITISMLLVPITPLPINSCATCTILAGLKCAGWRARPASERWRHIASDSRGLEATDNCTPIHPEACPRGSWTAFATCSCSGPRPFTETTRCAHVVASCRDACLPAHSNTAGLTDYRCTCGDDSQGAVIRDEGDTVLSWSSELRLRTLQTP